MPGTTKFPAALDDASTIKTDTQTVEGGVSRAPLSGEPAWDSVNQGAAILALEAKVGIDGSTLPTSLDSKIAQVAQQLAQLTGFDVLAYLSAASSTVSGPATKARTLLRAVAPSGTTGTVDATAGGSAVTLTINGPAKPAAIASGQNVAFAGTVSGPGLVTIVGA